MHDVCYLRHPSNFKNSLGQNRQKTKRCTIANTPVAQDDQKLVLGRIQEKIIKAFIGALPTHPKQ